MYVYLNSESGLWTVGFYDPKGDWHPESDHGSQEKAAYRAAYLNGSYEIKENELQIKAMIIMNDVAKINANTKLHFLVIVYIGVCCLNFVLQLNCALNRIYHAGKFGHDRISR